MFDIHNYHSFIAAVVLFQLYPGAGTLAILNATAKGGVRGGMKAVFGTLSGDFIYMLSAVLGLAAIIAAYPGLLLMAQWVGAIYLIWIGVTFLREKTHAPKDRGPERTQWDFYRQALAVSLTNPKAIMFFMAFFPLFLGTGSRPLTLGILMVHVTAISFVYQSALVVIGNVAIKRLSNVRYLRLIASRLAGVAIMGFGVKLLLAKKS